MLKRSRILCSEYYIHPHYTFVNRYVHFIRTPEIVDYKSSHMVELLVVNSAARDTLPNTLCWLFSIYYDIHYILMSTQIKFQLALHVNIGPFSTIIELTYFSASLVLAFEPSTAS